PYIYVCFYSELRERGGRKGKIIAKYLPQIWCVLGAQRSSTWGEIRLQNKIQDLKNPVRHLLNPEITRGFLHEAIGHCFEFPIFHWLIDSGKEIRGIEDILERSELPENIALYNTFSLASRACSEGFALWLLFYGEHILSKKNLWPSYLWKAERHKYLSMHRGNPYSVGLEAYETIENFAGEICALLSYLIAFDLPQKIIETKFNPDDEKTFFQKSINNPNFRLQSLTTMALPLDFRRNDGKRFIILAKKNIRAYCKKKPSCTLTGKMREADKSLDVQ
ncbi:MAG: hypothetical protein U9N83_14885, partial [Thermodesulfobacteriota bacterium]|nr:hypothetical protein [Thermodesulfobacteriota bacterium]